jgi:hypothetical protein
MLINLQPYVSILNGLLLALPIYYFTKFKHLSVLRIYIGISLITLYGILECISIIINKIFVLYLADTLLLVGVLAIFAELMKLNVYKKSISNPVISIVLIFMFLLGTTIINNLFYTPYLIITFIYYVAIVTLAHIYQILNRKSLQIPESLLIISIIVCYIYDTLYFGGKISLQEYTRAPWHIQYIFQSLAGVICFIQVKLSEDKLI